MSYKAHLNQVIASHLVELKADEVPDQPIFIFEKGEHGEDILTYKDLREFRMNRPPFPGAGHRQGDHYAIYMRNTPSFSTSWHRMVLGAIAVPVDPRYRGERLKTFFTTARPSGNRFRRMPGSSGGGAGGTAGSAGLIHRPEQNIPFSSKCHALNETWSRTPGLPWSNRSRMSGIPCR